MNYKDNILKAIDALKSTLFISPEISSCNKIDKIYDSCYNESCISCIDELKEEIKQMDNDDNMCSIEIIEHLNNKLDFSIKLRHDYTKTDAEIEAKTKLLSTINANITVYKQAQLVAIAESSTIAKTNANKIS